MTRRDFLRSAAGVVAALPLKGLAALAIEAAEPETTGFDHLVVVTMENRSFDHLLGWLPGADGRQAGLTYPAPGGGSRATYRLAPDFQGCARSDPAHSYAAARTEYAGGACDGWLRASPHDDFAIGYYTQADLPFLGAAAPGWTTLSRYFPSLLAGTFANRIHQHAGQTDRLTNTNVVCRLPTIWDRLADAGLRGRSYYSDVPILALWGGRYRSIGRDVTGFFADCAVGALPELAFVDPPMLHERSGLSQDDHPHADIRDGEAFLAAVYRAVTTGPSWPRTLLVITFDEWGGFYDHVPPPRGPIPDADRAAGSDGLRGFRVPCVLISPWARRGHVSTRVHDHASILRTVEARWNLPPLTDRDATAANLADELDLSAPNLDAPQYPVPTTQFGQVCRVRETRREEGQRLLELARATGWPV